MGDGVLVDAMLHDGLLDAFSGKHMGEQSDEVNAELGITRVEQDRWAARSHQRAHEATVEGRFREEIAPINVVGRRGEESVFDTDEGIRADSTVESLGKLKPAFSPDGTITAGNASQISDGAAAVVVMSAERAHELGVEPLAEIVSHGMSAEDPPYLHTVPALAVQAALKKAGSSAHDLDLLELNEAFAAVALHSTRMLFDGSHQAEARVNVNGGGVALGHPIGCSGARIVVTLLHELRRRGGGLGAAALCGGGGQGDALVLKVFG
jgi:acetyl-CoA C-acetyltransferase